MIFKGVLLKCQYDKLSILHIYLKKIIEVDCLVENYHVLTFQAELVIYKNQLLIFWPRLRRIICNYINNGKTVVFKQPFFYI